MPDNAKADMAAFSKTHAVFEAVGTMNAVKVWMQLVFIPRPCLSVNKTGVRRGNRVMAIACSDGAPCEPSWAAGCPPSPLGPENAQIHVPRPGLWAKVHP